MKNFFGITMIALLGLGIILGFGNATSSTEADGYEVGDTVKDFVLKNTNGQMVSLKGYLDKSDVKGVAVIFTCNTCPYAVAYEDRIIEFHNTYEKKGYPVLAINPNDPAQKSGDSFEKMQERAKDKSFPFDYAFDETQEVVNAFGASKTPHVFLVDGDMKVRYIGAIDNNATDPSGVSTKYLEEAVSAVESGKNPDPDMTKAVGCSIKFKKGT